MDFENLRFYVKTRRLLGVSAIEISNELVSAYGSCAPSYSFVLKWFNLFTDGRENIKDETRSGRPRTAVCDENIERVREIIEDNPYSTYAEIEVLTSLHPPTIHTIIHDHLHLRKITSRFVPHELSDQNKRERVRVCRDLLSKLDEGKLRLCDIVTGDESWFYHRNIGHKQLNASWIGVDESPRTIVRRGRFEPKTMFSIFFKSTGMVHISYINDGKTINTDTYINNCLEPMLEVVEELRPTSGLERIKLLHDNARPHVAESVVTYLDEKKIGLIDHPPYSPDLSPPDFWLFSYLKSQQDNHESAQSLNKQLTGILKKTPRAEYHKSLIKWKERMRHCIDYNGEYFEHYIN